VLLSGEPGIGKSQSDRGLVNDAWGLADHFRDAEDAAHRCWLGPKPKGHDEEEGCIGNRSPLDW